ncbi:cysteine hydrolase family protein [Sporolactobacillus nakayamae]|uniref:Nicotinamidase-related amidase n=1 Tax=Sporolactobacillus nakayamae TaxID=269670 RepID=A0A1I2VMX2_9BACL|nr:isochorismatase family cysteine hydrolase [Sporolactobacillus nakayamae]SFG90664.1 Nicotinamidase-related amidase [Sporolactobacillus nakayamae]
MPSTLFGNNEWAEEGDVVKSDKVLLIIDMINPLQFSRADLLLNEMRQMVGPLADLIARARQSTIPIIFVNDNSGRWESDRDYLISEAMKGPGASVVRQILPASSDYFIIKPKHSGFFATPLHALLHDLGAETLILTGVAGNICVLFTANDAYMRDYKLIVPKDCCASNVEEDNDYALRMMHNVLRADTRAQADIEL